METIQTNSKWEQLVSVKKGDLGEQIVKDYLEKQGLIVYKPITKGAHLIDYFACKDKQYIVMVDAKSKARMNKYYATGININHYNSYKKMSEKHNMKLFLFFIDEHPKEQRVYGNFLSELEKEYIDNTGNNKIIYPNIKIARGIILFSLNSMRNICQLNTEQINKLRQYSNRNYKYE